MTKHYSLPAGFTTLDKLAETMAGKVYALARVLPPSRMTCGRAEDTLWLTL